MLGLPEHVESLTSMKQSGGGYRHPPQVRIEVLSLYRNGYDEQEIVDGLSKRGGVWEK